MTRSKPLFSSSKFSSSKNSKHSFKRGFGASPAVAPKNIVFLTDSWTHNDDDTIFPMALHLANHKRHDDLNVYIIDRSLTDNAFFFDTPSAAHEVKAFQVGAHYDFDTAFQYCTSPRLLTNLQSKDVDIVFMMIDQPIGDQFLMDLPNAFPNASFLNDPQHACEIGNKAFLDTLYRSDSDLAALMPETTLCRSLQDVKAFASRNGGRIVLKTLQGYGGTGVKRYGAKSEDADITNDDDLVEFLYMEGGSCIAMQRLDHPEQEDNRLLVVNGQIVGTLKRRAKDGAFLCNICAGGQAELGYPNEDEINLVRQLSPMLQKHGLRFVGIDTLRHIDPMTGQERRYLSEINTLNTGGLSFMNELTGRLVLETATDMMIDNLLSFHAALKSETVPPKLRQHYALTAGFGM